MAPTLAGHSGARAQRGSPETSNHRLGLLGSGLAASRRPGMTSVEPSVRTTPLECRRTGREPMSRQFSSVSRRRFLQTTALGAAATASGLLHAPGVLRAQGAAVKLGVLHPVSGAL